MKKCYATIHVWLHDMDHNIDLNYRRKIRPLQKSFNVLAHLKQNLWLNFSSLTYQLLLCELKRSYSDWDNHETLLNELESWLTPLLKRFVKFIYSEKATKFFEISTLLLSYVVPVKSKVEISQNFVAFSEYMNFTTVDAPL